VERGCDLQKLPLADCKQSTRALTRRSLSPRLPEVLALHDVPEAPRLATSSALWRMLASGLLVCDLWSWVLQQMCVTSRADVHYVVTEHGIAYLPKDLRERAEALIAIADPRFQTELEDFACVALL